MLGRNQLPRSRFPIGSMFAHACECVQTRLRPASRRQFLQHCHHASRASSPRQARQTRAVRRVRRRSHLAPVLGPRACTAASQSSAALRHDLGACLHFPQRLRTLLHLHPAKRHRKLRHLRMNTRRPIPGGARSMRKRGLGGPRLRGTTRTGQLCSRACLRSCRRYAPMYVHTKSPMSHHCMLCICTLKARAHAQRRARPGQDQQVYCAGRGARPWCSSWRRKRATARLSEGGAVSAIQRLKLSLYSNPEFAWLPGTHVARRCRSSPYNKHI